MFYGFQFSLPCSPSHHPSFAVSRPDFLRPSFKTHRQSELLDAVRVKYNPDGIPTITSSVIEVARQDRK